MAKTVKPIAVELGIKGGEQLAKLNSAFRQLAKTIKITDRGLEDARQGIIEYGKSANNSVAVIKGQIAALEGLKEQADINGEVFRKISKDIKSYSADLRKAEEATDSLEKKTKSLAQVQTQFTSKSAAGLNKNLAATRQNLEKLTPLTEEYGASLQQLVNIEGALQRASARELVAARAGAATVRFARGGDVTGQIAAFTEIASKDVANIPNTLSGIRLRLSELNEDLSNVNVSSESYKNIQKEILEVEKKLAAATGQKVEKLKGVTDQQRRAEELAERSLGRRRRNAELAKRSIAGFESSERREVIGALGQVSGAEFLAAQQQVREISSLYKNIGDIGLTKVTASIEMMGKSYKEVAQDIRNATAASNNSISSLNNQRASWIALRNQLDPAGRDFREVTKEIEKVDRALEKSNSRRRKFSAGAAAQTAGAAISGGIFGGPEGFLGGVAGGIIGGPGGAFAGAAAGAQLAQLRKAAGEVAAYVAELNLAKATLAGVSKDQLEYNQNLEFARKISGKYALRIKDVIESFAGVTAAAKANNLTVKETQQVFEGITASGIAFGKSQEDLQALFLATIQVLSKGKASAEEISGQIGERIPGAVAKFAAATGRSLPELAKAFQKGEVTIADFVKFTQAQGEEYAEFAKSLASGPEKAGLRLQIALDTAGENFGTFFQKTGAGVQDLFTLIVDFANNNQEVIKGIVADVYIAGQQVLEIFRDIAEGISTIIGPAIKAAVDLFNRGVGTIYAGFRRNKELQAGGLDKEAADKFAADSAENVTSSFERLFGLPRYRKAYQEAYAIFEKEALAKGKEVLGDGVENNRQAVIDKLFGEFKPSRFSGKVLGSAGGNGGAEDPSKPRSGGSGPKDISDLQLNARLAALAARENQQDFAIREKAILLKKQAAIAAAQELQTNKKILAIATAESAFRQDMIKLAKDIDEADKERLRTAEKLAKAEQAAADARFGLRKGLGLTTKKEEVAEAQRKYKEQYGDNATEEDLDLIRQKLDPTFAEGLQQAIRGLRAELEELTNPINVVVNSATAIGGAFANAFTSVITGAQSTQEALGDAFKKISEYFLQMATEIIAKQLVMITLQAILKALGGPSFGGGGGDFGSAMNSGMPLQGDYTGMNLGGFGAFGKSNGGPVSEGQSYIVGERGPELFTPLQGGKITSNEMFRSAAAVRLPFTRNAEQATTAQQTAEAMATMGPIQVKYESQVINGVEYVTAEQHRQGMAMAAERGRALTLSALQNSVGTRKKVGL